MRLSIIIPSHNEGATLLKTVASCHESGLNPGVEIIVSDDASADGSVEETVARFESTRVIRSDTRLGVSATKARGARGARGEVLLFLDGHCRPEPGAIERLFEGIEASGGQAVVTPAVATLDVENWQNDHCAIGHGGLVDLETLTFRWADLGSLRELNRPTGPPYRLSPSLAGCVLAVSRSAYERIGGFDTDMLDWGVEDVDFGLKAWLMGHPILHDPGAIIGHRFRTTFAYQVRARHVVGNSLRMAWKHFAGPTWEAWLARFRARSRPEDFEAGWTEFGARRDSAERERDYLERRRDRDLSWFVKAFGIPFQVADHAG